MSVMEDIMNRRTRQNPGVSEPVAKSMGDQASARVSQGESGKVKAENQTGLNPTAEQVAAAKMLVNPAAPQATAAPQAAAVPQVPAPAVAPKVETYTDMYKAVHPELDAEAKAKREKQLKTKKQVAAIGDAISALANMHYTGTSGVNAYDPSATLSGKAKENYDKFLADVKTYEDAHKAGMLRAAELDAAKKETDRKEAKADQRYDEAKKDADRKEAKADQRYEEQKATAAATAKQTQENWEKQFAYNKEKDEKKFNQEVAKAAADDATKRYIADLNAEVKKEYNANLLKYKGAKASEKTLGTALPFHNNEGEPIVIYENVWKTSRQQVYNEMLADGVVPPAYDKLDMTPAKMDYFIQQKWMKSPKAAALMKGLALITPATLPVLSAEEDDYSQYAVGGDDYSQYIVE